MIAVPSNANEINRLLGRQKLLQDRLQELHKKEVYLKAKKSEAEELSPDESKELDQAAKDLDEATNDLIAAVQIVPLAKRISDEEGKSVELPKKGDAAKGRKLFTEKGCLACHSHEGTTKAGLGVGAALGEANFGPNLSRIAAKIAPEIGGEDAKRRWLIQWVLNPTVYHPRTRMPITHLSPEDASDVAEWLLSQKVTDWDDKGPETPATADLIALARLYLGKAPGFTHLDVENFLPANKGELPGIPDDRLANLPPDSDERKLNGPIADDAEGQAKLKWYIGRKAINRLGCFGCHDLPGFETAKPIGTALNDWGKKDPERLAFEDSDLFVRDHYSIVKSRNNPDDPSKPAADWHAKDGKPPYEQVYAEAVYHHRREGFLHQKLEEPRSFDFHRARTWDDRLRMPQFRFARIKRHEGESDEAYKARQEFEEAEAREAVMTFVLGLIAEPMPLKYLNKPGPDRLAEVKGHQVLEKFNCTGCHQVRPGVYEFKTSEDGLNLLQEAYRNSKSSFKKDHVFPGNNAWIGAPQPSPDRLTVFGTNPKIDESSFEDRRMLVVRLTDALRFAGTDRVLRDLPAASIAPIIPEDLIVRADPWGGTFTDLMIQYVKPREPDADKARSTLPPPLIREGERVQPNWVYGFLLNPPPIRPQNYMMLRMPKFNMSGEDARALANYFSGVSRLTNPGAGVTAEYVDVHQRDEQYWRTPHGSVRQAAQGRQEARRPRQADGTRLAGRAETADRRGGGWPRRGETGRQGRQEGGGEEGTGEGRGQSRGQHQEVERGAGQEGLQPAAQDVGGERRLRQRRLPPVDRPQPVLAMPQRRRRGVGAAAGTEPGPDGGATAAGVGQGMDRQPRPAVRLQTGHAAEFPQRFARLSKCLRRQDHRSGDCRA